MEKHSPTPWGNKRRTFMAQVVKLLGFGGHVLLKVSLAGTEGPYARGLLSLTREY